MTWGTADAKIRPVRLLFSYQTFSSYWTEVFQDKQIVSILLVFVFSIRRCRASAAKVTHSGDDMYVFTYFSWTWFFGCWGKPVVFLVTENWIETRRNFWPVVRHVFLSMSRGSCRPVLPRLLVARLGRGRDPKTSFYGISARLICLGISSVKLWRFTRM